MNNRTNLVKASQERVHHFITFRWQPPFVATLYLPKQFKVVQCTEKGKDGIKPYTCSKCLSGILLVVEQTDCWVKGWGAWTTQKSSDPRNRLWQSGTHFTNCSNLSNYSLVTRYFVSRGGKKSQQNKYDTFASLLASFDFLLRLQ